MNHAISNHSHTNRRKSGPVRRNIGKRRRCIGRRLAGFLHQLRERKVCRAAAAYAILTWMLLQLGEIVFPALALPEWTLTLVVLVAIAGFPVAMILAWVLQWTEDGLVVDVPEASGNQKLSAFESTLNLILLLAAILVSAELVWENTMKPEELVLVSRLNGPPAIAVIPFSGEKAADNATAHSVEQFLRYELINNKNLPVQLVAGVSQLDSFSSGTASEALDWVIEGSIHTADGKTRLLLHLIELPGRRYLNSWSLLANPDSEGPYRELAKSAVATMSHTLGTVRQRRMVSELNWQNN